MVKCRWASDGTQAPADAGSVSGFRTIVPRSPECDVAKLAMHVFEVEVLLEHVCLPVAFHPG